MTRVLLTGASGFVGRPILESLRSRQFDVHVVSRKACPAAGIVWHACDLREPGAARRLLDAVRPELLIHNAWVATPGIFWRSPDNLDWLHSSVDLFRAFYDFGGRRAVGIGTGAEYDSSGGICLEDKTPLAPSTLYGGCKNAARQVLEALARNAGREWSWCRLFSPFGPGEPRQKLVASVIINLLAGRTARCSDGRQLRDYLHVEDIAEAVVMTAESSFSGCVNVASGVPVRVRELVELVATIVGRPELLDFSAARATHEPEILVADVSRLHNALSWTPAEGLEQRLRATIEWWRLELSEKNKSNETYDRH